MATIDQILIVTPPWQPEQLEVVFEGLVALNEKFVRFAFARLSRCGGTLADTQDCVQKAYVRAFRYVTESSGSTFDARRYPVERRDRPDWVWQALVNWFYKVLHAVTNDRLRQLCPEKARNAKEGNPEEETESRIDAIPDPAPTASRVVSAKMELASLEGFLSERERAAWGHWFKLGDRSDEDKIPAWRAKNRLRATSEALDRLQAERGARGPLIVRLVVGMNLPITEVARRSGVSVAQAWGELARGFIWLNRERHAKRPLLSEELRSRLRARLLDSADLDSDLRKEVQKS